VPEVDQPREAELEVQAEDEQAVQQERNGDLQKDDGPVGKGDREGYPEDEEGQSE